MSDSKRNKTLMLSVAAVMLIILTAAVLYLCFDWARAQESPTHYELPQSIQRRLR